VTRASIAVALLALALPSQALAHATLSGAVPATQSSLGHAPRNVTLRFDQVVTMTPSAIVVVSADGRPVSGPAMSIEEGRGVSAPLRGVRDGEAYTVRWRATSSDGHTASGVYTFGVGVAAPPPTEAYGATGPTWSDDVARWAYVVALSVLLGTLGFRLLVLRGRTIPPRLSNRLYLAAALGGIAALNVGVTAFVMRAADALQLPLIDLFYADLSPMATKTRFGIAFIAMTLGFALVTALVLLAWIFDARHLLWPAFLLGAGFASGLSLSGHQGVEPNSTWATETADWLHLVAATLWVGGIVTLVVFVWPLAPELRRAAFLGFSRLATVLVAVLLLAGTYISIARLPHVDDLWQTGYGHTLLVKVGVVAIALAWGAVHHFLVRPRLERGDAPVGLRRSLAGETTVAMAVLLVAAVLVNSQPPPVEAPAGTQAVTSSGR
jgi:copper transport protein